MVDLEKLLAPPYDPLLHEMDLPLRAVCHPLGFQLNLATNSHHAVQCAEEAWSAYSQEFRRQPVKIEIVVRPEGRMVDEEPSFHGRDGVFSIIFDRHNFGVYETASLFGYCFVSEKTAADHVRLRTHFLEAMVYSMLAQRHAVPMHAAAVMRGGRGFLLCGPSGAGKSTLAYTCARAGWTFVGDDAVWLPADAEGRRAIGKPRYARFREDAPGLFPELARYAARQRPNGKMSIEAATADFPQIRTATHCPVDHLVLLERQTGRSRRARSIPAAEVVERILADASAFGERVRDMHERTLGRLLQCSAWRLEYGTSAQALELLSEIK